MAGERDLIDLLREQRLEEARRHVVQARQWRLGVRRAQERLERTMAEVLREELQLPRKDRR
jgi:hypothetical protein